MMSVTEMFPGPARRTPGRTGYGFETNGFPRM